MTENQIKRHNVKLLQHKFKPRDNILTLIVIIAALTPFNPASAQVQTSKNKKVI